MSTCLTGFQVSDSANTQASSGGGGRFGCPLLLGGWAWELGVGDSQLCVHRQQLAVDVEAGVVAVDLVCKAAVHRVVLHHVGHVLCSTAVRQYNDQTEFGGEGGAVLGVGERAVRCCVWVCGKGAAQEGRCKRRGRRKQGT